jgi:hypothetical protein
MLDELEPVSATISRATSNADSGGETQTAVTQTAVGARIPVQLHTRLTELGLLEITLQETASADSWRLAFRTRSEHP